MSINPSNHLQWKMILLFVLLYAFFIPTAGAAQNSHPMLHQEGIKIVDKMGRPVTLRGVNLGAWLLWEGWETGGRLGISETDMLQRLTALIGSERTRQFREQYDRAYVTEQDIARIAQYGFNVVRVPINHRLLRASNDKYPLYNNDGWEYLDRLIGWCERYGVYVVIDLHSIPGGQSRMFTNDPDPNPTLVWHSTQDQEDTVKLWRKIAMRYKDRSIVAGYDLLNEPAPPNAKALLELYARIIVAIRAVDRNHLVFLQGTNAASDLSLFDQPLDANMVYSIHVYTWFGDNRLNKIEKYKKIVVAQQVPLWVGEFGENHYKMIETSVTMFNKPENLIAGWAFWSWKRAPATFPGLNTYVLPRAWSKVIKWISAPIFNQRPDEAAAIQGLQELLAAVDISRCTTDKRMLRALRKVP